MGALALCQMQTREAFMMWWLAIGGISVFLIDVLEGGPSSLRHYLVGMIFMPVSVIVLLMTLTDLRKPKVSKAGHRPKRTLRLVR